MPKTSSRALVASVLALAAGIGLAACSMRSAAPVLPAGGMLQHTDGISPDTFGTWVYTCDINTSLCPIYTRVGTTATFDKNLQLTGNPSSSFTTSAGKWYVALRGAADIAVYDSTSSGPTGPTSTLSDSGESPVDVAVNTTHGIVAVANLFTESDGSNTVSVYAHGATSPTRKLHFTAPGGSGGYAVGIATDSSGDCFLAEDDIKSIKFYIVEFTGCNGSGTIVFTSGADTSAGGVALDGSDNLFFVDTSFEQIYRCTGTASCHVLAKGFQAITFIRFDKGWQHLWTTDHSAKKLYALNPTTGHKVSTTSESTGTASLSLSPGPAY